jgi:hypothetical protein
MKPATILSLVVGFAAMAAANPLPVAVAEAEAVPIAAPGTQAAQQTCSWVCGPFGVSNSLVFLLDLFLYFYLWIGDEDKQWKGEGDRD